MHDKGFGVYGTIVISHIEKVDVPRTKKLKEGLL